jgi:hypothetical protein
MMMLAPLPNPVPGAGNFNVMLPGKFWRAAKRWNQAQAPQGFRATVHTIGSSTLAS